MLRADRRLFLSCVAILSVTFISPAGAQTFDGTFEFRWKSEPSNRHRIMELLSPVSFTDEAGRIWSVPAGTMIDGASIPPVLWTFAGSPFVGNYRRASVIHDHHCDIQVDFDNVIHNMFLEAMKADGIGLVERLTKYAAVSVYSRTIGTCGRQADPIIALNAAPVDSGIRITNQLTAALESVQVPDSSLGLSSIDERSDMVANLAEVENPRTFAALASFRRVPSDGNLSELETAIREEQPSEMEMAQLVLLANATVPEGSIALPDAGVVPPAEQ